MRVTAHQKLIGLQVPGAYLYAARASILLQALFLLWSHLQVVVEHNSLAVEHEVAELGVAVQNIEQFINGVYEAYAELLECLVPFTVPVGMRDNDNVELPGHNTSLVICKTCPLVNVFDRELDAKTF